MLSTTSPSNEASRLDAMERRFCFSAWPQTTTHTSWFDVLEEAVGMRVSRNCGRTVGEAERAVGDALLRLVGVDSSHRVADDYVPLWAMQAYAPMRQHLSIIAALCVLPALKLAVSGAEVRFWDGILGAGVRHVALLLARTDPHVEPPTHATELRRQATAAAKTAQGWEVFSYRLGLAALSEQKLAVRARVRLAWPHALRDEAPLALEDSVQCWLVEACLLSTQLQRVELPVRRLAA
jgi:hypothetical protein